MGTNIGNSLPSKVPFTSTPMSVFKQKRINTTPIDDKDGG